jgi:hypothetical protein
VSAVVMNVKSSYHRGHRGAQRKTAQGYGIVNEMYDLQTFTNFSFLPNILKEQYDLRLKWVQRSLLIA